MMMMMMMITSPQSHQKKDQQACKTSNIVLLVVALLFALLFWIAVAGCQTAYVTPGDPSSPPLSVAEYEALSAEAQQSYTAVKVAKPGVGEAIDSATGVLSSVLPFVPPPYGEIGLVALLGAGNLWQRNKGKKTKTRLEQVELGARITADSVEEILKPMASEWKKFKNRQNDKRDNADVIMPNEV